MPGNLSSPELARHAKKLLPDLAVLFTSGYTANAIVHGGRLDPGVELLSKPYTHEALAKKIRHVLANQQHSKRLRNELEKRRIESPEIAFSPLRILLVEDEAIIRANTQQLLTRLGHTVMSADSIAAALACSENSSFDLILVDIELPDGSGTELVEIIKKQNSRIGVVYATGQSDLLPGSGDAILHKPYDIASLKTALSKFVRNVPH
jgi:CheY-like chemotaxis protein